MTNLALVVKKLAVLEEHTRRLRERRPPALETFTADLLLQDAIAMGVLVVAQESLDIALHIASDEGWKLASTNREAFEILALHGVIEEPLARALAGALQLRNRIAHGYATLDAERLYEELPAGIASFEAFATAIAVFLSRSSA